MTEIEERFWAKVDWDLNEPDRCWPWLASKMWRGYGQFSFKGTAGRQHVGRAHRMAYEMEYGPTDLHIDHLCHDPLTCKLGERCPHRACCNPRHMRAVTNAENHASDRAHAAAGGLAAAAKRRSRA